MSAAFTPKRLASTLWHVSVSFWLRLCNSLSVVLPAISFCHPHWYTSQPHISRSQHTSSFSPSVLSMRCVTFPHQREPCHSFPWLCDPISLQQWTLLGSLHLNYKSNTQPSCKYLCLSDNGNSRLYPAFVISQNRKPATHRAYCCTNHLLILTSHGLPQAVLKASHYVDGFAVHSFNKLFLNA